MVTKTNIKHTLTGHHIHFNKGMAHESIKVRSLKAIRGTGLFKNSRLEFYSNLFPEQGSVSNYTLFQNCPSPHTHSQLGVWVCPSGDLSQPLLQVLDVSRAGVPFSTLGTTLHELHFEGQLREFKFFAFLSQLSRGCAGTVQCAGGRRAGDS